MATKKFVVRDGFVLFLPFVNAKGEKSERFFDAGETVDLDEADAAGHAHKLEFAKQIDRDAALAAEKAADVANKAAGTPAELVQALVAALGQQLQQAAPAAAATTA